jgi:hypothetical protein
LSFMYGHSLHWHVPLPGAATSVFSGAAFCIGCRMPASVATMRVFAFEVFAYSISRDVDPMKLNSLEKIYLSLRDLRPEITMSEELRKKALKPIERMLEMRPGAAAAAS